MGILKKCGRTRRHRAPGCVAAASTLPVVVAGGSRLRTREEGARGGRARVRECSRRVLAFVDVSFAPTPASSTGRWRIWRDGGDWCRRRRRASHEHRADRRATRRPATGRGGGEEGERGVDGRRRGRPAALELAQGQSREEGDGATGGGERRAMGRRRLARLDVGRRPTRARGSTAPGEVEERRRGRCGSS